MNCRKPMTKLFIAAALGVTGLLAMTGSAFAGVADYTNTSVVQCAEQHGSSRYSPACVRAARPHGRPVAWS